MTAVTQSHLSEIQVHEAEGEELETDWEAVEQPVGERAESVGRDEVVEVEGEQQAPQRRPQQAQEQEDALVTEAFVSVPQDQPQLGVDEDEEEGVEGRVDHRQAQRDVGRQRRAHGGQGLVRGCRVQNLHGGDGDDVTWISSSRDRPPVWFYARTLVPR